MNESKWRGLIDAARHNDEQAVRYFIEEKRVPPTVTNSRGQTIGHIAVLNDNLPMLEYALGVDSSLLTILDQNKNNVLFLAIERGAFVIVQFLIECHQVDILQPNRFRFGANAVHIAAKSGNLDILRYFVEGMGADVNVRNNLFETPVFYAAEGQRLEIVQYLVEAWNVDVTCTDWNGDSILYTSAKTGDLSVPRYLMDERGVMYDINGRDKSGDTIVNRATRYEQLEFVRYFVEQKGADVNIADNFNRTPLYHAASLDNFQLVQFLLRSGADIQIGDLLGKTPDKLSTVDAVIKLLKKTMADKQAEEKAAAKKVKESERLKVRTEKELEKQKMKAQKEAEKRRVREEKESAKQKLREEKMELKGREDVAKNTTMSATTALKKAKNATASESRLSHPSNLSAVVLSEESSTTNSPFQSKTVSNDSRELEKRSRRNAIESLSVRAIRQQFSYREVDSQDATSIRRDNSWQVNSFLIMIDLCFKLFKYPRTKKNRPGCLSQGDQGDVKSRSVQNSFIMEDICASFETNF